MRNYGSLFLSHMARGSIQKKTDDPNFTDLASSSVTKGGRCSRCPFPRTTRFSCRRRTTCCCRSPPTGEPQDYVITTMALRRFPGIGPGPNGAAGAEVLQLVGTPWHVTKAEFYAADAASMEFFRSEEDPIGELLPVNSVLGAFILRGDMHTNAEEWLLLEDLKKTTRINQTALTSAGIPRGGILVADAPWVPADLGIRQPGEDYFVVAARGPRVGARRSGRGRRRPPGTR